MRNKINLIILILALIIIFIGVGCINLLKNNNEDEVIDSEYKIKSKILQNVIQNKWDASIKLGTKDSTFDYYDIYFDEGIEIKYINNKIFNIVFTENYDKKIINNIKADDSLETIIEELGNPDFGGKSIDLIGYKYDELYIFFNGRQASVYSGEESGSIDEQVFNKTYNNEKEFLNNIIETNSDYDSYVVNENNGELLYCLLSYAKYGIRITYIDDELKVTAYNNSKTAIPNNNIYVVDIRNKNLIYEVETERQNSIHNREYAYDQYESTEYNLPPDFEEINEEYRLIKSSVFLDIQSDVQIDGTYYLQFVCINGKYPNFEINERVYTSAWLDDYNIVYSIKNKGLYLYDLKTREKTILKEGNDEFYIYGLTEDNNLKVDNTEIKIDV